jgi:hypothetical protein
MGAITGLTPTIKMLSDYGEHNIVFILRLFEQQPCNDVNDFMLPLVYLPWRREKIRALASMRLSLTRDFILSIFLVSNPYCTGILSLQRIKEVSEK